MENMVKIFIEENKESLHHQLLDSLGLFEYEETKEYAPDDYYRCIKKTKKYPQITDDEYEKLLAISKEKEHIEEKRETEYKKNNPEKKTPYKFTITSSNVYEENFAVNFMMVLAWILWIGGLLVSFFTARVEVAGRYSTETVFQWSVFISSAILYFTAGAFCMCFSQVFSNIQTIASAIQSFKVTEEQK